MTRRQSGRLKKAFLDSFRQHGNITRAATEVGMGRQRIYEWQEHDEAFAQAFRQAEIEATEHLEAEAHRRAVEGVERLKFDRRGDPLRDPDTGGYYREREFSDTLLIFLLKARAPEKYRDRHDITSGGKPLGTSDEDLDAAIEHRLALLAAGSEGAGALVTADAGAAGAEDATG